MRRWVAVGMALLLGFQIDFVRADESGSRDSAVRADPCQDKPSAPAWLDRMQAALYRTTCRAASRFDGLFGNEQFDIDDRTSGGSPYGAAHGRLSAGVVLSERDQLEGVARFRLHVRLPQLSERVGLFIGQEEPDDSIGDARDDSRTLHRQFGLEQDDDVLIGLGYRRLALGSGYFDTSAGTHLGSGFDPYVRMRYRVTLPLLERNVVRLSESMFWDDEVGVGVTSRVELDRLLTTRLLARWTGSATYASRTEGMRWFSAATIFQSLGAGRALAYRLGASGESGADVPVSDYGVQISFRRRAFRDWMFIELRSGVSWPRESLLETRDRNLACGVGLEMWFGERPADIRDTTDDSRDRPVDN
jgi:hypothetical protein